MPDPTAKEAADTKEQRPARGLKILIALLVSIILPAALYAIYVFGQLEHVRQHNLRGLESTAQAVAELLENTRTTVGNLTKDPGYACMFFQRQNRARLITPTCELLASAGDSGIDPEQLQFDVSRGTVDIVGNLKEWRAASYRSQGGHAARAGAVRRRLRSTHDRQRSGQIARLCHQSATQLADVAAGCCGFRAAHRPCGHSISRN